jgi:5-methylcytosine-specific restriction endonuclease McrA
MIRDDVVRPLLALGNWSELSARLGERAHYRCEYCGLGLLDSPCAYKLWQNDHIVPVSRGGNRDDENNLAVACKSCNWDFKCDYDPREAAGPNASREELIAAAKKQIEKNKAEALKKLESIRRIMGWQKTRE